MAAAVEPTGKRKFTFPTAYTILAFLIVVGAGLTYIIPAGKYDTHPDDGAPVPDSLAVQLFNSPVPSNSGLGVGMYQAAKFARQQGYEVALSENQSGKVCFRLAPAR